jgi:large subunit ribosomal protein L10
MVMKHALAKKALSSLQFSEAGEFLKNNVLVTIADKEPQIVSKALVDFAKTNAKLVTAGVIFEKKVYGQAYVKALAQLPSRHELLTQVVVRIKSPITGFVMTLGQLIRGLVVTLNEVKKQKEAVVASA